MAETTASRSSVTTLTEADSSAFEDRARIGKARSLLVDYSMTLGVVVAVLGLLELLVKNEWVSVLVLSAPSDVASTLWAGLSSGAYIDDATKTLTGALLGFLAGAAVSMLLAGLLAMNERAQRVFKPIIVAIQAVPKIAIAPVLVLWLGYGIKGQVVNVAVVCFFPIFINTLTGLLLRDRTAYEMFMSLGASRFQLFRYLRLPSALPYIFAGLNIGIVFALLGAVVSEFVGAGRGLGYRVLYEKSNFNVEGMYAAIVMLSAIGVVLHGSMGVIERRTLFWSKDATK
jgi:NitT/TauT family transport system permease protein